MVKICVGFIHDLKESKRRGSWSVDPGLVLLASVPGLVRLPCVLPYCFPLGSEYQLSGHFTSMASTEPV